MHACTSISNRNSVVAIAYCVVVCSVTQESQVWYYIGNLRTDGAW